SIICSPMTSLKTSIKTITYLSDIGCLEIQGASLKGLSMLSKGWPGIFAEAAQTLAFETLEHATRADHIDSDRYLIKSIYYNLFSGEDSNKKP
ncbi:hypothetical protein ACRW3Y_24525, partial [Escherichia coli]